MGRRAERAALHLGQSERRVVGGDDHVGVAHQTDPAADAESVDGRYHRHRALIDRLERGEAAPVGVDQRGEAGGFLHLLDVDARVEAAALGTQDHHPGLHVAARGGDGVGEFEPAARRDGVDRGIVDRDRDDSGFDGRGRDRHGTPKQALAW